MARMCTDMRGKAFLLWLFLCVLVLVDIVLHLQAPPACQYLQSQRDQLGQPHTNNPFSAPASANKHSEELVCAVGTPCEYPEEVDLRLIIMSYNRAGALTKLLESLAKLDSLGDTIALDIWIDRGKDGSVHAETLSVARQASWDKGPVRVHVQTAHAGIYGQWIDTWRPRADTRELALLLEDDLIISPHTWRWLKAAHAHYGGRPDIAGYTTQSEKINVAVGGKTAVNAGKEDPVYLYMLMGSWGYAPHPAVWRQFQDWFHAKHKDKSFHPYVKDIIMTQWYKNFEKQGTADGMWTMWFIHYCNEHKLFTLYNNLNRLTGTDDHCMAVHRAEPGLHYHGKPRQNADKHLLATWSPAFIAFPQHTQRLSFAGKAVNQKS